MLNLQFHSFEFTQGVISPNDTVRISVTSLPDEQKQATTFNVSKMHLTTSTFNLKDSDNIQKIIVVFRKKKLGFIENIFASTIIRSNEFSNYYNSMKRINIYEPVQRKSQDNEQETGERKVVGTMILQIAKNDEASMKNSTNPDQATKNTDNNNEEEEEVADGIIFTDKSKK